MSNWHRGSIPALTGRSDADIAAIAARARKVVAPSLPAHERLLGVELFERLRRFKVKGTNGLVRLDYHVDDLDDGVEAMTRLDDDAITVVLSTETYCSLADNDGPRSRFTLGHELGHAVLHHEELRRLNENLMYAIALRRQPPPPAYKDCEVQANKFASFLLAPTEGMRWAQTAGEISPDQIAARFGLSNMAAEIRIKTFNSRGL